MVDAEPAEDAGCRPSVVVVVAAARAGRCACPAEVVAVAGDSARYSLSGCFGSCKSAKSCLVVDAGPVRSAGLTASVVSAAAGGGW